MSAPLKPMLSAIAFQLAAALESYQLAFDEMIQSCDDPQCYAAVNRQLDNIRMYRGALPQLSVDMVEVLIAHVDVMHALWGASVDPSHEATAHVQTLRGPLRDRVERMRAKCLRLCSKA